MGRAEFTSSLCELKTNVDQADQWVSGACFNEWKERIVKNLSILDNNRSSSDIFFISNINNAWRSFCDHKKANTSYIEDLENLKRGIDNLYLQTNKEEEEEERFYQIREQCPNEFYVFGALAVVALFFV